MATRPPIIDVHHITEAKEDVLGYAAYSEGDTARIASKNALNLLPRIANLFASNKQMTE